MSMSLKEALDADMARLDLDQKGLAFLLRESETDRGIDSSAISNWKNRGVIPRRRERKLMEVLGVNSKTAEYIVQQGIATGSIVRGPAIPGITREVVGEVKQFWQRGGVPDDQIATHTADRPREYGHAYQIEKEAPEWMAGNFESQIRYMIGGYKTKFDYISPKVVAEIKFSGSNVSPVYYRNLVRLAAARAVQSDDKVYGMILINDSGTPVMANMQNRFSAEANALQVRTAWVSSVAEAISVLENWESDPDYESEYEPPL